MAALESYVIVGVRRNPDIESIDLVKGITHYSLNLWRALQPGEPQVIPVLYRGGYRGGFSAVTAIDNYLLVADGTGILAYDLGAPSKGYIEFSGVNEVSDAICKTPNYIVSCLHNLIQVRTRKDILEYLKDSEFSDRQMDIPYRLFQHEGEGNTNLTLIPLVDDSKEMILLNNAEDNSYLIEPRSGHTRKVEVLSESGFPHTFQRQQQYHLISEGQSQYTVFTESTFRGSIKPSPSDRHPNRVYSLDIRGPPIVDSVNTVY